MALRQPRRTDYYVIALYNWQHFPDLDRSTDEFLMLTEEGRLVFRRRTKKLRIVTWCPPHGSWEFSNANGEIALQLRNFHCTGNESLGRDYLFRAPRADVEGAEYTLNALCL